MSGHSKWSSIKHQKGAADAKRGAVFSKLSRAITVAARHGTDPNMNFQLRLAIDQAHGANVPKDNIERAIDKAKGSDAAKLEEIVFEAYGPGGTGFLIEAATDNHNRSTGDIRAILNKHGGKLAESGSVGYLFKRRGQIVLENVNAENAELAAIDAGAQDVEADNREVFVYTDPKELEHVRRRLADAEFASNNVSFEYHPTATVPITDEKLAEKIIKLATALDDLDDITKVSSNFEIPENLIG
ncbi:MAG: transcriptional regulator [Berkelbacteria bacterium GW2011_GWA2_46_7]|uniref:Probable transcriptional regulatory protein UX60_C0025G0001 n=1 Tax=Berkelbacteria bacterium GW2011_GWA2_46_7 TaxID=1618335 RepID=A0A0G1QEJ1_9BACT|nr:MAG: transcriptional regulator [Berkelbacteria bacterium GW2011_GWA2_46_7]